MRRYRIVNIQDLLSIKAGEAYKGEVAVFQSSVKTDVRLFHGEPVYVNAFAYILILSGKALLSIEGNEHPVSGNTLCILSPVHLAHFSKMTDDFSCVTLCLHKDFVDRLPAVQIQRRIARSIIICHAPFSLISGQETEILKDCIEHIRFCLLRTGHIYQEELIQNAVIRFYIEVDNILDGRNEDNEDAVVEQPRHAEILRNFISLLILRYKKEHTVSFYSQELNITPQYLTAVVKAQTGHTVNDFIYEMLYCESRNLLLSSELSIQQIAIDLNFSDQATFSKFFKRHSGMSPFEYRKLRGR